MNVRNNLDELLDVLEKIRKEKHPHIPADIIKQIVEAQYNNQDSEDDARRKTDAILNTYINKVVKEEEK